MILDFFGLIRLGLEKTKGEINLPIINASAQVIEEIKKMRAEDGLERLNLRIAGRIDLHDDKMGEGYQLFQSELTLNDQYQEFDGFNIIVANILLKINGGFNLECEQDNGKARIKITPHQAKPSGLYRGTALGTAARQ